MAASEDAQMSAAIAAVKEQYPNDVVRVTEAGTLAIFVPSTGISPSSASSDRIYAPEGGTYSGFLPPIGYLGYDFPMNKTFLPGELAEVFYICRADENKFDKLINAIDIHSNVPDLLDYLSNLLGIPVTTLTVSTFALCNSYKALRWLDLHILKTAMENGTDSAISITRTVNSGVVTDLFFGWGGTYVDASPYEDWDSTWYPGDYSIFIGASESD